VRCLALELLCNGVCGPLRQESLETSGFDCLSRLIMLSYVVFDHFKCPFYGALCKEYSNKSGHAFKWNSGYYNVNRKLHGSVTSHKN